MKEQLSSYQELTHVRSLFIKYVIFQFSEFLQTFTLLQITEIRAIQKILCWKIILLLL